ncbi:MAG: L,D-transpeptidase family protein [Phreatobacter sp.]|uniref:L,D-transpeptidase n=1 Tax=Phreatobacter sp. TaxID=1966341 RepID=UPI002734EF03|nr:L,D-transpeptidase family protein [Phreatobacter sp.]MDP2803283.1 L,D-transpeptidase family protein [Phreatobacter sp.]
MRAFRSVAAFLIGLFLWTFEASAAIVVRVDKTSQTMRVIVDGEHRHTWAVSTGRAGYNTPNGSYRPQRLERSWHSRKYGMAPMPHSIFFRGGYAIHGTTMVSRLGRVDSHGCIRLAPGNARTLFEMVARQRGATRIVIEGTSPRQTPPALVASRATRQAAAVPRTAQMRLAQPGRQVAAVPAGTRTAQGAPRTAGARVATAVTVPRAVTSAPRGDNRYFAEWFLRR